MGPRVVEEWQNRTSNGSTLVLLVSSPGGERQGEACIPAVQHNNYTRYQRRHFAMKNCIGTQPVVGFRLRFLAHRALRKKGLGKL